MTDIQLAELVGGALQEKFGNSLSKVLENMQDVNTPYKDKRSISIKLSFQQNEQRDDIKVHIDVTEKLAPQGALETAFMVGKDLRSGEIMVEEYGKQIKGQMSLESLQQPAIEETEDGRQVNTATGEIIDFRKIAQ